MVATRLLSTVAIAVSIFSVPAGMSAQTRLTIAETVACRDCRLQIEKVVQLGGVEGGPGYIGAPGSVVAWRNGWAVVSLAKRYNVSLFDLNGAFIRDIGRAGSGPGEYRFIGKAFVDPVGDLLVVDQFAQRITRVRQDLTQEVAFHLPSASLSSLIVSSDTTLLINSDDRSPRRAGMPFHIITRDGEVLRSFGADTPFVDPRRPHAHMRVMTPARGGGLWSARTTDYVVERWQEDGRRTIQIRRRAAWFPTHGRAGFNPDGPPNPSIRALWEDDQGLLWVLIHVADEAWKRAVAVRPGPQGNRRTVTSQNDYFDTIIEVLDPRTGQLVVRGRMRHATTTASGGGIIVTYEENETGVPMIQVWRPRIHRKE
jgi:hypothetical protein